MYLGGSDQEAMWLRLKDLVVVLCAMSNLNPNLNLKSRPCTGVSWGVFDEPNGGGQTGKVYQVIKYPCVGLVLHSLTGTVYIIKTNSI